MLSFVQNLVRTSEVAALDVQKIQRTTSRDIKRDELARQITNRSISAQAAINSTLAGLKAPAAH